MPKKGISVEISVEISRGTLSKLFGIQRSEAKLVPMTTVIRIAAEKLPRSHHRLFDAAVSLDAEMLTTGPYLV